MAHLILTTNDLASHRLRQAGLANVVIGFCLRFVWGRLPLEKRLVTGLEPRSVKHRIRGDHWLDDVCRNWLKDFGTTDIGFFDLCEKFDSIELWVDPCPNDQLVLVWLLDLLRPYKEVICKLSLVHTDDVIAEYRPEAVAKWKLPVCKATDGHLVMASRAWHAYREPTPEGCFNLLSKDLTILPRLRSALIAMLEELPDQVTGVGATEMMMLEYVQNGCDDPRQAFGAAQYKEVFVEREAADLLDDLAQCPRPAISGFGVPFEKSAEARYRRYMESKIALTQLGRAIVEGNDDFCHHNPICRWWGGTQLTNERLWRWDGQTRSLIAP